MFFRVAFLMMFSTTVVLTFVSQNVSAQAKARKFDELSIGIGARGSWWPGKYQEEEKVMQRHMRRYATQLRKEKALSYIIGYAGRVVEWEWHNRSYGEMRAGQAKEKLSAFFDYNQITTIDGGFREKAVTEFWIVPPGAEPPKPNPTIQPDNVAHCPFLRVDAPLFVPKPRHLEFKAILNTNEKKIQPGFTWRVSPGTITSGQGTYSITVAVPDGVYGSVIARVDVTGYSLECPLSATTAIAQTAFGVSHFRLDQYEQICSDDEKARLDNLVVYLQKNPELLAYIVFYGGRCYPGCSDDYPRHRPRYPRKGEAQQRAGRIKPYLEMTRGIDGDRIVVVDGGNRESWTAELWLVVKGGQPPPLTPTVQPEDIQFRRGKPGKREFVIGCLGPNP